MTARAENFGYTNVISAAGKERRGSFRLMKGEPGTGKEMDGIVTERAVEYLSKEPLLHMDMLESIRCGSARLLSASDRGVLLFSEACRAVMMSARDGPEAERMFALFDSAPMFVAHQRFYLGNVRERFDYSESMVCFQAAYLKKGPLPEAPCGAEIRLLDESFLPFLAEHYSHASDEGYLLGRLRAGVMFGAFLQGRLAGFIGLHEEGSMGMLEVLPEFRRRGVALSLETFLSNRLLAAGRVPFVQIVEGNAPSLQLHRKLGFSVSKETLCWLM